jgi:hypothetical protein
LAVGCFPSRATKSAAEVGCSADEISISDAPFREGLLESAERWTAECHGRTYYCTQGHPQREADPLALVVTDPVICQEETESAQEVERREARTDVRLKAASQKNPGAPSGAAGFSFGLSDDESRRRCEAAGRAWTATDDGGTCSGPAAELALAAKVHVALCEGRACRIAIDHQPVDSWAARSVRLKAQLESKYGPPQTSEGRVPETCRSDASFSQCLQNDVLHLSYGWHWSSGESLQLEIGKPAENLQPAIRLVYSRPESTANLSNL